MLLQRFGDTEYERGAALVLLAIHHVRATTSEVPRFAFPPRSIFIAAVLDEVGLKLARNEAAVHVVGTACANCMQLTGRKPTAMMLRIALEMHGIPYEEVSLGELGIKVGAG